MPKNIQDIDKTSHAASEPGEDEIFLVHYACTALLEFEDIKKVNAFIRSLPNARLIFHTRSAGPLTIVPKG
jgi:hypothetical protein